MTGEKETVKITSDPWLRVLMKISIPMAVVSVAALWIGQLMGISWLFYLFLVAGAITLAAGLAYNVRFVILNLRRAGEREQEGQ